jgi:uncharacterized protein DUF6338
MPTSLDAALVFGVIVVPGYLLLRGYYVGRAHIVPEKDLYVLAQAVVGSLIWLAATWIVVEDLLGWIQHDQLGSHVLESYGVASLIVVVPYIVGRLAGALVRFAFKQPGTGGHQPPNWLRWLTRQAGIVEYPSAWETAWAPALAGRAIIEVRLDDNSSVLGVFAGDSDVNLAPRSPQIFFEDSLQVQDDGSLKSSGAIHVDGSRIVSIRFVRIDVLASPTKAASQS